MSTWTTADIPDQSGRTAVITGANTGLGFETAKALADKGARVVLAVRDTDKGRQAAARIGGDVTVQELDLTSLASIRAASEELHTRFDSLDLLINNAGVMTTPKATTKDGFELQFGTNHLGHFALTGLLLDRLLDVDGARIVTVSSNGHKMGGSIHFDDLQWERRYNRMGAYTQSKLANLLFTYELQRRLAPRGKTAALAAHPGTSTTELARNLPVRWNGRSWPRRRCCSPRRPTKAHCRHCAPPPTRAPSAASTTAPTASASSVAIPSSSHPATSPTTWISNDDCGRSPRS